jgi:DNA-binding response OmpR family regulator
MKKRIIVAEDDTELQNIFRLILEKHGYEVEIFSTAEELINGGFRTPDLFLLDKQLGGVDGVELCLYLKSKSVTHLVPVILISANPGIGKYSESAGADGWIEKPFQMKYLLKVIADQIEKVKGIH